MKLLGVPIQKKKKQIGFRGNVYSSPSTPNPELQAKQAFYLTTRKKPELQKH